MDETEEDRLETVRANVQRYRKAKRLSQAELAELVTCDGIKFFPQTVQKIENGSRTIRLDEAIAIAKVLEIRVEDLLQATEAGESISRIHEATMNAHRARDLVARAVWQLEEARDGVRDAVLEIDADAAERWSKADRHRLQVMLNGAKVCMGWSVKDLLEDLEDRNADPSYPPAREDL